MRLRPVRVLALVVGLSMVVLGSLLPEPAEAQTPYVPYFGHNRPRYTRFEWFIYKTDHFEIYYYPEVEKHLTRVASYAESAYQHVSSELKHDLADRVPLIIFKTNSEFQQQNVGGELPEGVLAFAEPERNRMLLPIDEPTDQLYELITHELTHIFEFDIIPRGIMGANLPLWMDEGLSDYMTGAWNSLDLMAVRDTAVTDTVPRMSHMENAPLSGRTPYSLGHAAFEFIESRWGKEGLRQFLFSLRKSVLGSGETAYEEAFKLSAEDFDDQFDRYLKNRFKPFRDKERPNDYGRNLAPSPQHTPFVSVWALEASPTGDILAAMVGNRKEQELDIVLLSTRDGGVIKNLTPGFDQNRGWEYIGTPGGLRGNLVPWFAWSPVSDHIAYFVRTEKEKTLVIQNIVTGNIDKKYDLKMVDGPESPAFSPDAGTVVFSALQGAVTDLFALELRTGKLTNLTKDAVADYAPTYAPDGKSIVYSVRVGGSTKLFQLTLATGEKKQITFGTHDDTNAKFLDDHTIVFTSTATDPNVVVSPEVIRNGGVPNVWSLDLGNGELKQWTDTVTGNVSPVVLHQAVPKVAFVSYYKGQNGVHVIPLTGKPLGTVASSDFGSPGPIVDFQPPLSHTLMRDNIHKKGTFEKMSLAGRPPVGLGVTSSGNFYGNTQISFTDILGDKQISFYAQSVAGYRTTAFTYSNIERRMQYAAQVFFNDSFFYGNINTFDPGIQAILATDPQSLTQAVSSQRGAQLYVTYPFNRYRRVEAFTGYYHLTQHYTDPSVQQASVIYQLQTYGSTIFSNGNVLPLGVSFVQETTIFREYGPVAGSTVRVGFESNPDLGNDWVTRQTADIDARYYLRLGTNGVLAFRGRGLRSWGRNPSYLAYGGNSEMRGYDYLQFYGQHAFFANVELRFPIIEAMLTPFGVLGGLRGTLYFDIGGAGLNGQGAPGTPPYVFAKQGTELYAPIIGYEQDILGNATPVYGKPEVVSGLRLVDGRASYGIGLESFLLGFPMHFDFSWKTLFNQQWEDLLFAPIGGHGVFRRMQFGFWIGYDF
jgi:hypothetical protein